MDNSAKPHVTILLSGGIDSAACVDYYVSRQYNVSGLFVDYGQSQTEHERTSALAIADYYAIALKQLTFSGCSVPEGYVPARNAMLLCMALLGFGHDSGIVALGIHAGTPYADCAPEFVHLMQQLYDLYEQGRIRIDAPFLHWTKSEIWAYAQMQRVPLHLTHSNNLDDLRPVVDHLRASRQ